MTESGKTPLHDFHVANNARMVPFAGWEMPVQYSGILEEHMAVRQSAGLFDVSHMGEARVSGKEAAGFLDYVATNNISNLKNGCARYTLLCYEDGGCVDDIIIYRETEDRFLICLNASNAQRDVEWMLKNKGDFQCEITDVSAQYAQLAIQGPLALDILSQLTPLPISELKPFRFVEGDLGAHHAIISATGYTGERGFEIYIEPKHAISFAEKLMEVGSKHGLVLAGLGARDSLRLEMGYPLYGHEISESISPIQAGLSWAVKFKKGRFIGKEALKSQADAGPESLVCFFALNDRRIARQGAEVVDESGSLVGEVLSGTHSPSLNQPIGSALVKSDADGPLAVRIRNKDYPLDIKSPPFVKTSLQK